MAGTFTVAVEGDWILLENGTDDLLKEDGQTALTTENAPNNLDLTQYLLYDSVSLKVNTVDFVLMDPPLNSLLLKQDLVTTNPTWKGTVGGFETSDPTEQIGHLLVRVTGVNTAALATSTAPFDLSESPTNGTFNYLLEDGVSHFLLEDGTDFAPGIYLIEGTLSYAYRNLWVRSQINSGATVPSTLGQAIVYQPGLRPGNLFKLTSTNQGYSATQFEVNQATITWPAGNAPWYLIEFGDTPQTLAQWAVQTAPSAAPTVVAPVAAPPPGMVPAGGYVPPGPAVYGQCTAGYALQAMGGGVVTIAQANFTVNAPVGHNMTVQLTGQIDCRAYAWDNYVATPRRAVRASILGGIFAGSWQELPAGTASSAGPRATYDLSSAPGISLPAGSYTVSIDIETEEYNQMEVFGAWAQATVTTV